MTEQYLCPSYYDDDGILRDCTCGKCGSKKDWLRSEIEKLEGGMKPTPEDIREIEREDDDIIKVNTAWLRVQKNRANNTTLTSIITRYKEELKELEKVSHTKTDKQ